MAALFALFCAGGAAGKVDIGVLAGLDIDPRLQHFIGSMQAQIEDGRKDLTALRAEFEREKKDKAEMKGQITALQDGLDDLSNKTKAEVQQVTLRLDQREADTTPFAEMMDARAPGSPRCLPPWINRHGSP